jgi:3-hydroxyacyl-[acyl-carrier-protein] dehydratase
MHFDLVDAVLEQSADRIVTLKNVSAAEEYLQDHFPTFPVLPGVLMIEAMVQAARRLLAGRDPALGRHVLCGVKALKYGTFVRPGDAMKVEVTLSKAADDGSFDFKGSAEVVRPDQSPDEARPQCVSGRFTLRGVRG